MENNAHSYTEAAEYTPEAPKENYSENTPKEISTALVELLKLHKRESEGDETITMIEWNRAIINCWSALDNAGKIEC